MAVKIEIPIQKEVLFGAISSYTESAFTSAGEVQYIRIELSHGASITKLRTYIHSGGLAGRDINLGVYDQLVPSDPNGTPVNRLREIGSTSTAGLSGFVDIPIARYEPPVPGFYWMAFITNSNLIELACTQALAQSFAPLGRETSTGVVLPPTVGTLSNPTSAVIYVAAVEM